MKERDLQLSDATRQIAQDINEIMKVLYQSITPIKVNLDVDLSSFRSDRLVDFFIFTSGYVAIQRIDQLLHEASAQDIRDIVDGKFYLGELNKDQVLSLCESVGHKITRTSETIPLSQIQDGKYVIHYNGVARPGTNPGKLTLVTEPVQLYSESEEVSYANVLQLIRNILAHEIPLLNGNNLQFKSEKYDLEMSSMWFRGLCETMSEVSRKRDATVVKNKILSIARTQHKLLSSTEDIKYILNALAPTLDLGGDYNDFIEKRLKYNQNYTPLSTEQKAAFIADLIFYNQDYNETPYQKPNPDIIYLIEKIVNTESQKRGKIFATSEQLKFNEIRALAKRKEEVDERIRNFNKKYPRKSSVAVIELKKLMHEHDQIKREAAMYLKNLETMRKTGVEDMYMATGSLENLNVEMAFNLVCLMAYNAMTISGFYDDMVGYTSFKDMNDEQKAFFESFNMEGLSLYGENWSKKHINSSDDKAFTLLCLRNALIHNKVCFYLPDRDRNPNRPDFKDAIIEFEGSTQHATVVGRVGDFARLFTSPQFFEKRTNDLISKRWRQNPEEETTSEQPTEENPKKPSKPDQPGED